MKLKFLMLSLSLFNCASLIRPAEVSPIQEKVDKICKEFQNFEKLLKSQNIDKNDIINIDVGEYGFIVVQVKNRDNGGLFWVYFETEGESKIATGISLVPQMTCK